MALNKDENDLKNSVVTIIVSNDPTLDKNRLKI